jgi:hypothetical protein
MGLNVQNLVILTEVKSSDKHNAKLKQESLDEDSNHSEKHLPFYCFE